MSFHLCQANLTVNRLFLLAWVLLHFTRAGTGIALQDDVFCFKVANTICFGKLLPYLLSQWLMAFIDLFGLHASMLRRKQFQMETGLDFNIPMIKLRVSV